MMEDLKALERSASLLVDDGRFGDWTAITNRTLTFYLRGARLLGERLPAARIFASALERACDERRYRVLGDPVVRVALNGALNRLKNEQVSEEDEVQGVLHEATAFLGDESPIAPLEAAAGSRLRLGKEPHHLPVWTEERDDDLFTHRFRSLFDAEIATSVSNGRVILRTPDPRMRDNLVEGSALLSELFPTLRRSALAHVHLLAIIDVDDPRQWNRDTRPDLAQNVSTHAIPGTIFLSPTPLRNPWEAAEALLHEALHKRLSDLVLTRQIFRKDFSASSSTTIRALWNPDLRWNSNDWSADRALFAFHVYVHLALFFAVAAIRRAELEGAYGSPTKDLFASARGAANRARYLGLELRRVSLGDLEEDGKAFIDWLQQVLDDLDPIPPHVDLEIELLLDRYDRETREFAELIERIPDRASEAGSMLVDASYEQWSISRIVDHLVHSDVVATYRILSILGEADPPTLPHYNGDRWSVAASSRASYSERAALFRSARLFVSRTLRSLPPDVFARQCATPSRTKTLRQVVEDAVEHPGRHLDHLLTRLRSTITQTRGAAPSGA